ncbi:hypothetical protein [Stigmatella hybrida]|uniref:hypothetical protein n=1 Tax=Stigmatella hybrida TaxID=394097 RepID=UPI001CDB3C80|nr:hypothetical protein [Stigmatella hybrida]
MSNWLPQPTAINDPIADDLWSYENDEGVQRIVRVTIGRPLPIPGDPNGDWYCPVRIEQRTPEILCMVGVGPVDALANAARVVSEHFHELRKVSPRARPLVKKHSAKSIRLGERDDVQKIFDHWGTDRAGFETAGAPTWLLKCGQPQRRREFTVGHAKVTFRPDVIWNDDEHTYVAELKSAPKYEPLALAQAFAEASLLRHVPEVRGLELKPVPVIITQFNYWNREALSLMLEEGLRWGREFYLEFDVVALGQRMWLWFDAPLAPLTPVDRPPAASDALTGLQHWYRIGSCEAWFGTERLIDWRDGLLLRPAIPDARYAICAAVHRRPNEWLLWSGSGLSTDPGEFSLLEGA